MPTIYHLIPSRSERIIWLDRIAQRPDFQKAKLLANP